MNLKARCALSLASLFCLLIVEVSLNGDENSVITDILNELLDVKYVANTSMFQVSGQDNTEVDLYKSRATPY